jgi:GT2 family glycosyltransferase
VRQTLDRLAEQSRPADAVIVCVSTREDAAGLELGRAKAEVICGERGSAHQRNAILRYAVTHDVVVFFDDDFVPAPDYLEALEQLHIAEADIAMATGVVLKDGIRGPGLSFAEADSIIARHASSKVETPHIVDVPNGYGCNMSVRMSVYRHHGLEFDERMPQYAWLEDVDFSQRLRSHGRIVKATALRGVHLGVKGGRQKGRRLGYSQIANPVYLSRKGTLAASRCLYLMSRNIAANAARSLHAEPWIDRRGRLVGNLIALGDLVLGRLEPGRSLEL